MNRASIPLTLALAGLFIVGYACGSGSDAPELVATFQGAPNINAADLSVMNDGFGGFLGIAGFATPL